MRFVPSECIDHNSRLPDSASKKFLELENKIESVASSRRKIKLRVRVLVFQERDRSGGSYSEGPASCRSTISQVTEAFTLSKKTHSGLVPITTAKRERIDEEGVWRSRFVRKVPNRLNYCLATAGALHFLVILYR